MHAVIPRNLLRSYLADIFITFFIKLFTLLFSPSYFSRDNGIIPVLLNSIFFYGFPFRLFVFVRMCAASLKNIGEKTAGLFDRKKKEMEEKAAEAQTYAEEQARKAGEVLEQKKKDAGELLDGAGKRKSFEY